MRWREGGDRLKKLSWRAWFCLPSSESIWTDPAAASGAAAAVPAAAAVRLETLQRLFAAEGPEKVEREREREGGREREREREKGRGPLVMLTSSRFAGGFPYALTAPAV